MLLLLCSLFALLRFDSFKMPPPLLMLILQGEVDLMVQIAAKEVLWAVTAAVFPAAAVGSRVGPHRHRSD